MKKIGLIAVMIAILVGAAVFAGGQQEAEQAPATAESTDGFDWRQFEGQTIVACWPNHGHYNATMDSGVIEEFEELTGIDVEIDLLQYIKMHDKQVLEMSKASGDYDMVSMVVMWKAEYAMGGMI
ncbi:MAG TPA: sugar ABC transporter substrate-binding protein, partial [Clostridia bacterium]|nr:sugar ABC transporter substrate-binding protein [Clostridia bacterium]